MLSIVRASCPEDIASVRALFTEYQSWLGRAVCSRRLSEEIETLPGPYAPPQGVLLLATEDGGRPAGCVGIRPYKDDIAEMKRLFVRPEYRRRGLARSLVCEAIDAAAATGYRKVVLTTLPQMMEAALGLYRSLGFEPIEPAGALSPVNATVDVLYMALDLEG